MDGLLEHLALPRTNNGGISLLFLKKHSGWFSLLLLFFVSPIWAATWHVPGDFESISAAIDAAENLDTIFVADGTYAGSFRLNKDLTIIGNVDSPEAVVLELDAFSITPPSLASCEGLTFSGTNCQGSTTILGTVRIRDCVFESFQLDSPQGIFFLYTDAEFHRCRVLNNHNVHTMFYTTLEAHVSFFDCQFENNSGNFGGVLSQNGNHPAHFKNCLFRQNHAALGGGAIHGKGDLIIESCLFEQNSTDGKGGGVFADGNHQHQIINSSFVGNYAAEGGAIATEYVPWIDLENTDFSLNSATISGPQGFTTYAATINMVCCLADLQLWVGDGYITLNNDGCSVASERVKWGHVKALYR